MAKKVRRVRRPEPARESPTSRPQPVAAAAAPKTPARRATPEELREEYAYVIKDLRRIFILAAVMFLLLIALNLALRF